MHASDYVFECVCACVGTPVHACECGGTSQCMCMHGCACVNLVIVYYVVCVQYVDACACVWVWPRKAAYMSVQYIVYDCVRACA